MPRRDKTRARGLIWLRRGVAGWADDAPSRSAIQGEAHTVNSTPNEQDLEDYIAEHREGRRRLGPSPVPEPSEQPEPPPAVATAAAPSDPIGRMFEEEILSPPPRELLPVPPPANLGSPIYPSRQGLIARTCIEGLTTQHPVGRARSRLARACGGQLDDVEEVVFPGRRHLRNMSPAAFVLAGSDGADQVTGPVPLFLLRSQALRLELVGFAFGPFTPPRVELVRRMPGCAVVLAVSSLMLGRAEDLQIVGITWLDESGCVPAHAYGLISHGTMPLVVRAPTAWFGIRGPSFDPLYFFVQSPPNGRFRVTCPLGVATALSGTPRKAG